MRVLKWLWFWTFGLLWHLVKTPFVAWKKTREKKRGAFKAHAVDLPKDEVEYDELTATVGNIRWKNGYQGPLQLEAVVLRGKRVKKTEQEAEATNRGDKINTLVKEGDKNGNGD
jgi:hypothetical protein